MNGYVIKNSIPKVLYFTVPSNQGAVKLHLLLDHDCYLPSYDVVITDGKVSDLKVVP